MQITPIISNETQGGLTQLKNKAKVTTEMTASQTNTSSDNHPENQDPQTSQNPASNTDKVGQHIDIKA